ncbi:hypothetical protein [Erythrobacter sp. YT30]|uniref:hypothetical protein n=1 Tax=Erythrobacter sp. YT30 TaxID=1735012 RepID=UPI00076D4E02|nr:hypothetical protein [Erythrobacter sp. YT30]KWV90835.1 hypothetical protein AUC45_05670 [Erythrobacter sp. YT30]
MSEERDGPVDAFWRYLSWAASSIGGVVAIFALGVTLLAFIEPTPSGPSIDSEQSSQIKALIDQIDTIKTDLYSEGDPVDPVDSSRILMIEERQAALDEALSDKAERIIALAAMRDDSDDLTAQQTTQIENLRQQVAELRTILLSLAASIIAILLGFVGWLGLRRSSAKQ